MELNGPVVRLIFRLKSGSARGFFSLRSLQEFDSCFEDKLLLDCRDEDLAADRTECLPFFSRGSSFILRSSIHKRSTLFEVEFYYAIHSDSLSLQ